MLIKKITIEFHDGMVIEAEGAAITRIDYNITNEIMEVPPKFRKHSDIKERRPTGRAMLTVLLEIRTPWCRWVKPKKQIPCELPRK